MQQERIEATVGLIVYALAALVAGGVLAGFLTGLWWILPVALAAYVLATVLTVLAVAARLESRPAKAVAPAGARSVAVPGSAAVLSR